MEHASIPHSSRARGFPRSGARHPSEQQSLPRERRFPYYKNIHPAAVRGASRDRSASQSKEGRLDHEATYELASQQSKVLDCSDFHLIFESWAFTLRASEAHGASAHTASSAVTMTSSTGDIEGPPVEETERLMDTEAGAGRSPRHKSKRRDSHGPASIKASLAGMLSSWLSRRFFSGIAVLFPLVVTVYVTWWFLRFFDNFFSPVYFALFGFHVFGLGFITSMIFIFMTGVFVSSWIGGILLSIGEWIIKKLPLVKHIYSAAKQVTAGLNPENAEAKSFRECVMIKHPRHGEYAIGFITGETLLRLPHGDKRLFSIYVPTNHVYVGDIFLMGEEEILKPKLSVREGLEVVVSLGMALPPVL